MNLHAIYHLTEAPYAYAKDEETLIVRIRVAKNDMSQVIVLYKDRYESQDEPFRKRPMIKKESTKLFDFYEAELHVDEKRFRYVFELYKQAGGIMYYGEHGVSESLMVPKEKGNFQFPYLCEQDILEGVSWASEGLVYQIFPDRFHKGNPSRDRGDLAAWGDMPERHKIFGGDIEGIIQKLDYIEDLGVDIIYMTPIFESSTDHKYNTKDYYKIDPQFGDLETVKKLVKKAHARGIRIVLDAVFNHSGDDFFAFEDVVKNGAASLYKEWYYIHDYPVVKRPITNYRTFATNIVRMPKFRTSHPKVRDYLLDVAKYWIEEIGIDGWRLDVCDEVDHYFWREFRKVVKGVKPDALIIGEIMHESVSFLKGDQLDTIMNYPFKEVVTDFFAKGTITVEEFESRLAMQRASYMKAVNYQMWNLIDSHDTPRFLTECKGDVEALKLAIAFQFTYIGTPYIYYGTEIGMEGGDDPDCRRCMMWSEEDQNKDLYFFVKRLNVTRKNHKALVYGEYKNIYQKEGVIAFKRFDHESQIYVFMNNTKENKKIPVSEQASYQDLYTNEIHVINEHIELGPMAFKILKRS